MDTVASIDPSKSAKSSKLVRAVVEKLKNEPQCVTNVMNIAEANASSDFLKRGIQILRKRHEDLLCQLEFQENQEDSAGTMHHLYNNITHAR
jgi:hypothetical protein